MTDDDPAADPPLPELSPAEIARQFNEVTKSFALTMKFISDLSLRIETVKMVAKMHGASDEEFDLVQAELKRRQESEADVLVQAIKQQRTAEALRRLLESAEGPKQ